VSDLAPKAQTAIDTPLEGPNRVWTMIILGGGPCLLRLPQNPLLDHDGTRTLWKFSGSVQQLDSIKTLLAQISPSSTVEVIDDRITPEQVAERLILTGKPGF
jgi:hypothetical protein